MKTYFFFAKRVGLDVLVSLSFFLSCAEEPLPEGAQLVLASQNDTSSLLQSCPDNNHPHLIDLGLSVRWACCNVGASSPIEYGGYYAWGETEEKTTYNWNTYKWCNGSEKTLTKYCTDSTYGTVDNKTQLDLSDDAARVIWGSPWRMPTLDEIQELVDNVTIASTSVNGVNGIRLTSKTNGNSIFLPVAGYRFDGELLDAGSICGYWLSTLHEIDPPGSAYRLGFYSYGSIRANNGSRYCGQSVRPVVGAFLNLYPVSLSLPCEASSAVFNVSTDQDYTINVSDSWITATASTDKQMVTVTATANTGAERTATVTIRGGGLTKTIQITQAKNEIIDLCPDNNHPHLIDLGLSVKWACCNVGASSPIEYGGYYAWGETEEKTTYDWSTYKWCNGSEKTLIKYCTDSSWGTVDNKTQLELSDDAARVKWGSPWRMPTLDEIQELLDNATSAYTSVNGVNGMWLTSKANGNSIFLPAAGYRWDGELFDAGSSGLYWSSTLNESSPRYAGRLRFASGGSYWDYNRYDGQSVRPVR